MPKCHKFYRKYMWTLTQFWSDLALDTVLITRVYWNHSANIAPICFTSSTHYTVQPDLTRTRNIQVKNDSPAVTSLYQLLRYHFHENPDALMDELLNFNHTNRSLLHLFPAYYPETTDDIFDVP